MSDALSDDKLIASEQQRNIYNKIIF